MSYQTFRRDGTTSLPTNTTKFCTRTRLWALIGTLQMSWVMGCATPVHTARQAPIAPTPPASEARTGKTIEDAFQLCFIKQPRTDYPFVAQFRCPDGSMPLNGDWQRAADARIGNVGPGPDTHIVDLYEIPCSTGPIRIFVDPYHCGPDVATTVDPNHLTRDQLASAAKLIRSLHDQPTNARANDLRRQLVGWLAETPQVTVSLCDVSQLLPTTAKSQYLTEYILSLSAAIIEDGRYPADPISTHVAAFEGVARYYQAVVRDVGPDQRDANLDAMINMLHNGTLRERLSVLVQGCGVEEMGVHP